MKPARTPGRRRSRADGPSRLVNRATAEPVSLEPSPRYDRGVGERKKVAALTQRVGLTSALHSLFNLFILPFHHRSQVLASAITDNTLSALNYRTHNVGLSKSRPRRAQDWHPDSNQDHYKQGRCSLLRPRIRDRPDPGVTRFDRP
jgi:hypothetical protein